MDAAFIFVIDNQTGLEGSGSFSDEFADGLRMEPTNRALVADMGDAVFVQNVAITLDWSSSSSTDLQFTVDYSMDGLHWNDYIKNGQVKVRRKSRAFFPCFEKKKKREERGRTLILCTRTVVSRVQFGLQLLQ